MRKLLLLVGGTLAAVLLLLAGIALGDALSDDAVEADGEATAAAAAASAQPIAAATPVPIDAGAAPGEAFTADADEADTPVAQASTHQIVGDGVDAAGAADLDALESILTGEATDAAFDRAKGVDTDATLDPWVPPTSPAFDPDRGEVDPEAPATRADDVEELDASDVAERLTPAAEPDLPFRFVDACAGETGDEDDGSTCPAGVGGTIALTGGGSSADPLAIQRRLVTSWPIPRLLRCPALGFDPERVHQALLVTNNPAELTIRYWPSTDAADVRQVSYETPAAERDRWTERRIAGERPLAALPSGVHNCPALPGLVGGRSYMIEVRGVDDAGTEAEVRFAYTPEARRADGGPLVRPAAEFTPVASFGRGVLTVPYAQRTEQVYVGALARAGDHASTETCTDIENGILGETRRRNPGLGPRSVTAFERSDGDGYLADIDATMAVEFTGEEGTAYDLCVWITRPPSRSFDLPPVVSRQVFTVRTPVRWRTRLLLAGGHGTGDLVADAISVRALGWSTVPGYWPPAPVDEGPFLLDEPVVLQDGGSSPVPSRTVLLVSGPTGARGLATIATGTRCHILVPCDVDRVRAYDVPIPGPGSGSGLCGTSLGTCEPLTPDEAVGNLRLVVEHYAGPSGEPTLDRAADDWQVRAPVSFASADAPELPETPRIDFNTLEFEPFGGTGGIAGGRPGARALVAFDRPVTVSARPVVKDGSPCPSSVPAQRSDGPVTAFTPYFTDLCWGTTYSLDVVATDADGNTLDWQAYAGGVPTPYRGWLRAEMPGVRVLQYTYEVTVEDAGPGNAVSRMVVGRGDLVPAERSGRCFDDHPRPDRFTVRNHDGFLIDLADPWVWELEVDPARHGTCADPSSWRPIRLTRNLPLDDLLDGSATIHFTGDEGLDVTVEITDIEFG